MNPLQIAVFAFVGIFVIFGVVQGATNQVGFYDWNFRQEMAESVSSRIVTATLAIDTYDNGRITMDLKQRYRIKPVEDEKKVRVELTSDSELPNIPEVLIDMVDRDKEGQIASEKPIYSDSKVKVNEFESRYVCIVKETDIEIKGGKC